MQNDVVQKLQTVLKLLDEVEQNLTDNETSLSNRYLWTGASHDTCSEAHKAVVQYKDTITPICQEMKNILDKLDSDVSAFS